MRKVIMMSLMFILLLSNSSTSFAYGNSLFVGGESTVYPTSPVQHVQGARATITTPSSFVSVSSGQMTSAWVAVVGSSGNLAQMGFASEPSVTSVNPHYFFGVIDTSQPPLSQYSEVIGTTGPSTSTSITFTVKKENGSWRAYRSNSPTFFAGTNTSIGPDRVQYYNESYDDAQKWYGTSSSKLKFSAVQFWDGSASASASDTSKWIWKKPNIPNNYFFNEGTGTSLDYSTWSSSSTWTSWK
ncbi:hypothetical protein RB620_05535 [Paenibacillus sp. LHD-117]|uniref:hypothetical protein n=1 Tax=Paenibacillus sp. LHD-117 TaxID=3071412 RepID=UPI0027E121AD|nr:hypothetical protein [Paenibacillus sp. LHD-117]MDQ6418899.1 hypothetical protein [Paenibacillus sp. LHD-117]